ncbi:MAG: hypothetical protein WCT02_03910 [Candidatus Paceibacterota bacterium]|jgi:mRNA-degrading endonuclease RelE of RelBE toxin-antitoxin system
MQVKILYKAERWLDDAPLELQDRIREKLKFYSSQINPISFGGKLTDREGYKFRVGNYRVICVIKDGIMYVSKIERRDKAYD